MNRRNFIEKSGLLVMKILKHLDLMKKKGHTMAILLMNSKLF